MSALSEQGAGSGQYSFPFCDGSQQMKDPDWQEKNNKGFSVLEVIVVLAIIGVISVVAYPNISHWNKSRQIENSAIQIKTLFTNINSQVQRGNYGFVQVYINSIDTRVDVFSKGITKDFHLKYARVLY